MKGPLDDLTASLSPANTAKIWKKKMDLEIYRNYYLGNILRRLDDTPLYWSPSPGTPNQNSPLPEGLIDDILVRKVLFPMLWPAKQTNETK